MKLIPRVVAEQKYRTPSHVTRAEVDNDVRAPRLQLSGFVVVVIGPGINGKSGLF